MPSSQDNIFADSEGDRWFDRNNARSEKFDPQVDPVCKLIELYSLKPRTVIEVGAAVEEIFRSIAMAVERGTVEQQLRGPVAQNSFQRLT